MKEESLEKKWLANNLSDTEKEAFDKLRDAELNQKIIEGAQQFKASQFSSIEELEAFKTRIDSEKKPVITLRTYKLAFKIAAIFVISLGVYFTFFFTNITTIETLASQKTTIELPDASSVMLNADSKITYHKKKWQSNRKLQLTGEAFFKVAKGSKFDVITSEGIISVLGTQFNVKSRENYFEVICFEGLVSVSSNNQTIELSKGKSIRIINKKTVSEIIKRNKPDWLTNKSQYKSVPLYFVLEEFKRQYNIEINSNKVDTRLLFTGGFVHTNIDEALKTITIPFNLTYKKDSSNKISLYTIE